MNAESPSKNRAVFKLRHFPSPKVEVEMRTETKNIIFPTFMRFNSINFRSGFCFVFINNMITVT